MITDARVLQPQYVPQDFHHRSGEIGTLTTSLAGLADGFPGDDAFVFGPSGTGKTTLSRHVVSLLEQQNLTLTSGYVDAMSNASHADALHALAQDAGVAHDLRREGTPASTYLDRLHDVDGQVLLVIDEVHVLEEYRTLQTLWEVPNVTLLLVCLDEDRLFADFGPQLQSRLGSATMVRLDRYSTSEMTDILQARVDAGLQPGAVSMDVLEYIADLAAGDARRGIALLRASVQHAQTEGDGEVTERVVEAAKASARGSIRESRVRQLGTDKRLLYEIVRDAGRISAGDLHDRYDVRAADPVARGTRRKYLARLQEYDLVDSDGEGRGTEYVDPHQ